MEIDSFGPRIYPTKTQQHFPQEYYKKVLFIAGAHFVLSETRKSFHFGKVVVPVWKIERHF